MYQNTNLQNYIEQSSSVNLQSVVIAEWNLNISDKIAMLGNYKNRPSVPTAASSTYVVETSATSNPTWYGYTDSNIIINTGLNSTTAEPTVFVKKNETEKILYSLTDCVGRFRPRSGINKLRYFKGNQYVNFPNENMFLQPRYYVASKDDNFKYWNSFRVEADAYNPVVDPNAYRAVERGIATTLKTAGEYYIDDAAPFVVYTEPLPANRIVVKMQTHASDYNNGTFKKSNNSALSDPFYEDPANVGALVNQRTPEDWKIQYLDNSNTWQDAVSFTSASVRSTGKRVVPSDGYVELAYGITNTLPTGFRDLGQYPSQASLPISGDIGDAYLVPDPNNVNSGTYYVWNGTNWTTNSFAPAYGWYLKEEGETLQTSNVTKLTSPDFYGSPANIYVANYREFKFIKGIRIVVNTMSKQNSMFELIEMSPRLVSNISDRVQEYSVTKIASDIGNTGIPVGELSASNGTLSLFDYDESLNPYNTLTLSGGLITGSILTNVSSKNLQIKFYEQIIDNRTSTILDYFVPIKTFYSDGFPQISGTDRIASIELRDLFFYLESTIAPSILMRNVKLSKVVATVLDNIGYSNYKFYKNENEAEDVIPYFYVAPETTVAEVFNDLAQSTQSTMFFDEENNFIVMSKNYIMPTEEDRKTNIVLYGTKDFSDTGVFRNSPTQSQLANIMTISTEDNEVFNGGKITYSNKYIQKSYGTIKEASLLNSSQSYKYKPVLLWEVAGTESLRPTNEEVSNQSAYTLSAMPLAKTLTSNVPTVVSGEIIDNIIDFGQSIYWLTRYEGYFYANGEIIKYKGVEHSIQSSEVTGLSATLINGTNTFVLSTGNIYSLSVGQKLTRVSGATFGSVICAITGIDRVNKIVTVSVNHNSNGVINFTANTLTNNVWVENLNDYQKYFAQVRFNGKMFPTGRVKIYAEPKYDPTTGAVLDGAVAKHGRMQFGTTISEHTVLDASNEWMQSAKHKAFEMQSKWLFKNNHQYTQTKYVFTGTSGNINQKIVTLATGTTTGNIEVGWIVTGTGIATGTVKVASVATDKKSFTVTKNLTTTFSNGTITVVDRQIETLYKTGYAVSTLTRKPRVESTIKDMFDTSYFAESKSTTTQDRKKANGSVKASALVVTGVEKTTGNSNDYLSYVYKDYGSDIPGANVFGTRMKILGKQKNKNISGIEQIPIGADAIDIVKDTIISGTGGGIAINLDVDTNSHVGYYFEIDALTSQSVIQQTSSTQTIQNIPNIYFYKVLSNNANVAIPVSLWYGSAPILVDSGLFAGMGKLAGESTTTVYDLSIETEEISKTERKFYLYFNNKLVTTVVDTDAIPLTNKNKNFALFVRGAGKCMFENVYAIQENKMSQFQTSNSPLNKILGVEDALKSDSYRKYLVNPGIVDSFLTGVNPSGQNKQILYYEEFGTVMRECAYFNIRYDKAYPALYSKISPTFNDLQGYLVSGFRSNPYGAEFLIFNVTDFALNLDETSGNYLRIQGITFTQQSAHDLTVDEFLSKSSSLNNYNKYSEFNNRYVDIQNSRNTYGRHDFTISGTYIQSIDMANNLMQWMVDKVMVPKKAVSVEIFANPMIQLGDIVTIDYEVDGIQQLPNSRFVVYHIEYSRSSNGPSMTLYLNEVI